MNSCKALRVKPQNQKFFRQQPKTTYGTYGMYAVKTLFEGRNLLGESAVWDKDQQRLYWADLTHQKIHSCTATGGALQSFSLPETIGSFGLCKTGGAIIALRSGVYHFNFETEKLQHLVTPTGEPVAGTRFNDGKVAPGGQYFFVGTMDEKTLSQPLGKLYRIDTQLKAVQVQANFVVSNGLAWTANHSHMFHACSRLQKIWLHDYNPQTGTISNRQVFASPTNAVGRPDGGATDIDGGYWSAGVSAAVINHFSASGQLLKQIPVPCKAPTMPCFGAADMQTLFITSLSHNHTDQDFKQYPHSGGVLAIKTHVKGVEVPKFNY